MIQFTSAKFQLNIHEVFILLGLKHLQHQSSKSGCCREGHFLGDLLEGKEKKNTSGLPFFKNKDGIRKVTNKWKANDYTEQSLGKAEHYAQNK